MRAEVVVGVRRNGRINGVGVHRPFQPIHTEELEVSRVSRELVIAVSTETITNTRKLLGHPQALDTVEVRVKLSEEDLT